MTASHGQTSGSPPAKPGDYLIYLLTSSRRRLDFYYALAKLQIKEYIANGFPGRDRLAPHESGYLVNKKPAKYYAATRLTYQLAI